MTELAARHAGDGADLGGRNVADRRAIARGVATGWLQSVVGLAAGPIYTTLILAAFPREEAGFWFVVLSLALYFALFDLGLSPTVTRMVAFARGSAASRAGTGGPATPLLGTIPSGSPADWYRTASRLNAGLVALVVALGVLVGPAVFSRASGLPLTGARHHAWILFVLGCAANLAAAPCYAAAAGLGAVSAQRLARAATQLLGLALTAFTLARGWGAVGAASAWAAQNAALFVAGLVLVRRDGALRGGVFRRDLARALARPSLQWAGMNLGAVLILASGPVIIAARVGPDAVPQFVVLRQLAETLYLLALLPAQQSEPFISRSAAAGDYTAVVALLRRNLRYVLGLLAVGAPAAAVLGAEVIGAWVGSQHFAGYAGLWLMLTLYVLEAHHVVHALTVMATGRVVFLRAAVAAGAITVVAGIAFAARWGVGGMAAAMLLAQLATNTWYAPWYALKLFRVRAAVYAAWLRPIALLTAAAFAAAATARVLLVSSGVGVTVPLLLSGLAGMTAAVLPIAWRTVLTPAERFAVAQAMTGWRRPGARS